MNSTRKTGPSKPQSQPDADGNRPVILCDDHIAIRTGLGMILVDAGISVFGTCGTVPELLEMVRQAPASIVITDLGIDDDSFAGLLARIKADSSGCEVIVYSMREAPATIGLCYEAGAIAFVPKSAPPDELIKAVECGMRGERYFPSGVASQLASLHVDKKAPTNILSARETEIFIGYAKEGTVEALAQKLGVSDKTVQNLLAQIAKKLDAPRSTFYHLARRYGLLD